MSAYNYERLMEEARGMEAWQTVALCAVCAEKIIPVIAALSLPDTFAIAQDCLAFAWFSANQKNMDGAKAGQLMSVLKKTAEWEGCAEPDCIPWIVGNALSLSEFALTAVICGASKKSEICVGFSLMLDIAERFEMAAEGDAGRGMAVKEFVRVEEGSQTRMIELLRGQTQLSNDVLGELQSEAGLVGELFATGLPTYCFSFVDLAVKRWRVNKNRGVV
jgi:hypothetical protein